MKRGIAIAAAALAALLAAASPASAERLVTSISRHQVLVTSSFTGTAIVLFGTIEPDTPASRRRASGYDLTVTVLGPKQTVMTRKKERMLGIWTNTDSRTFVNVPSYLAALSTRPIELFATADMIRQMQLGLDSFLLPQQIGADVGDPGPADPFRTNFVRLKTAHRLYSQKTNGVTLLTPTVFRTEITLPAEAPIGSYEVDVRVFTDRLNVARGNSAFEIVKVGFEQFVATAARDYGFFYGIAAAMMAMFTGWFASVVFRRD
ncbi:MAG TPA: TIGR02186 family protein [Xanthobacteraceae bacterium]|jgi:uncharacterized protein (TIGR02186 family)